jgi:trigger factor
MMAKAYGAKVKDVEKIIKEQGRIGVLAENIARKKAAKLIVDSVVA